MHNLYTGRCLPKVGGIRSKGTRSKNLTSLLNFEGGIRSKETISKNLTCLFNFEERNKS